NNSVKTGDLCWRSDNATVSFAGGGGELVKDTATGVWRMKNDDGTKVERLTTGAFNPDNDGEYWRLTTTDGTQYYLGLGKRSAADTVNTNSTWTVPVFGNHPGDPCRQATFSASSCVQAYRWNLDYVVDPRGNTMTYYYATETNNYGRNLNQGVSQYMRGGYLTQIDYAERAGTEHATSAPSQVVFGVSERCLPSGGITCAESELTQPNASHWPDVPYDQICSSSTSCPTVQSPSFFTRKRLTSITTQVWNGAEPAVRQPERLLGQRGSGRLGDPGRAGHQLRLRRERGPHDPPGAGSHNGLSG
ncbi:MAG: hypothetical protein L0Y54_16750, partial [Sporichthyaceae bacterium]|nr:hypothetical protein [Sporichthyaceae bacterium]